MAVVKKKKKSSATFLKWNSIAPPKQPPIFFNGWDKSVRITDLSVSVLECGGFAGYRIYPQSVSSFKSLRKIVVALLKKPAVRI